MIAETPQVKLPRFEGPLDLLLYLIRQQEIDIHDIPINQITHQYLSALDTMGEMNLEIAGEFILMVSYLLYLKAEMLLPHPQVAEEAEDPRTPLVQKLLEYQKFKQIGEDLKRLEVERAAYFPRGFSPRLLGYYDQLKVDFSAFDLYQAYIAALKASPEGPSAVIRATLIDIEERMEFVRKKVSEAGKIGFLELVEGLDRLYLVATFIALLELVRRNFCHIRQASLFGKIQIVLEGND